MAALINFNGSGLWLYNTANGIVGPFCFPGLFLHGFCAQDNSEMCFLRRSDGQCLWLCFVLFVDLDARKNSTR